jgi:hypothetical protein
VRTLTVAVLLPLALAAPRAGRRAAVPDASGGEGGVSLRGGRSGKGTAVPGIGAVMTGVEGITFGLAAALAAGTMAFRAAVPRAAGMAMPTLAAVGFLLALLHWAVRLS